MKRILMLAVLLAASLGMGQDVAQQQPQEPKLHGFKARLCATSTLRDSPAFDKCMATGFGKPRPSQPRQQAATATQPVVAPQAKPQEPITAKADPAQTKTQEPLVMDTSAQAKAQGPLVMDTSAQAKTQAPLAMDTPVQAKTQAPLVMDAPVQAKTCIEYMTTASGAQTCLRWRGDQDQ